MVCTYSIIWWEAEKEFGLCGSVTINFPPEGMMFQGTLFILIL